MRNYPYTPELATQAAAAIACLRDIAQQHAPAAFANSFGVEDMVLMHMIASENLPITVFSLDTGRLPEETYAVMTQVRDLYPNAPVEVYYPQTDTAQNWVRENGVNAFYQSVELRKACCGFRKVEPLQRALKGKTAWITGQRRAQAVTRADLPLQEWDGGNNLHKFNPLTDWSEADVWAYVQHHQVPTNALHAKNYPSIGCAPCTRSVAMGEDIRAGRWWWENPENKECGLHVHALPH
mgnify:FL=1